MSLFERCRDLAIRQAVLLTRATVITIQTVGLVHLFTDRVGFVQRCQGESMLPTLSPTGDWVFNNRLPFHYPRLIRPFSRGDVVTAVHPFMPDRIVGKRIIALEGDTVEVNPGRIRVDVDEHLNGEQKYVRIPKGHCWLQGDNLSNSTDSRDYGPVPMALLLARVETRIFPTWTPLRNNLRWLTDDIDETM